MFSTQGKWITLPKKDVVHLPGYCKKMINRYCTFDKDNYYLEKTGFKKMDLSCYLNHSAKPNIVSIENGKYFEALRTIKAGEELFVDYGKL